MARYVYGPVPSRRLGSSLGVDLVPHKTCTFDCLYCQLGPTEKTTTERAEYTPVDDVVEEVRGRLQELNQPPDYVTLGGSGEPTLHASFGEIARRIKVFTDVPICLLSNGSLFSLPEVRQACKWIDLIVPSLDAPDPETYQRVNRPNASIRFSDIVSGLEALRREFDGEIWLEVFLLRGINDSDEHVARFRELIDRIHPDRVQLNTAIRPPAEESARAVSADRLGEVREVLGQRAEVIASPEDRPTSEEEGVDEERVLEMLRRRPCTVDDISSGLGVHRHAVIKSLRRLSDQQKVSSTREGGKLYYRAETDRAES